VKFAAASIVFKVRKRSSLSIRQRDPVQPNRRYDRRADERVSPDRFDLAQPNTELAPITISILHQAGGNERWRFQSKLHLTWRQRFREPELHPCPPGSWNHGGYGRLGCQTRGINLNGQVGIRTPVRRASASKDAERLLTSSGEDKRFGARV
jgi:hypothetical protein